MNIRNINTNNPVIAWWSGGASSAVTCKLCVDCFGKENVRIIFIDTKNEDDDTYRFKGECEVWYDARIETLRNTDFDNIEEVWDKHLSLNVATGAICSYVLKRIVRERFERENNYSYQAFGFDIKEINRARGMKCNNPKAKAIFPLISSLMTKEDCLKMVQNSSNLLHPLQLPKPYLEGYHNNNCFKTGCVQGGIGYWQKIQKEYPHKFSKMAEIEHKLTELKGAPVTLLRTKKHGVIFLKPNSDYPNLKDISMVEGKKVLPLIECNGFCGMDDIEPSEAILELNLDGSVDWSDYQTT